MYRRPNRGSVVVQLHGLYAESADFQAYTHAELYGSNFAYREYLARAARGYDTYIAWYGVSS